MAYEVIKRVSGRAYRYRVESFRDPETRRVRGRWTYLGRVDPADAGLPPRPPKPSSKERLLEAVARLLTQHDAESLSAGSIAREAGVAYGTFYRYFRDRAHAVRETLLRHGPALGDVAERFALPVGTRGDERGRMESWIRENVAAALRDRGLVRAWHIYSNSDDDVLAARRTAIDAAHDALTGHLERLHAAGIATIASPGFTAYALVALVVAMGRDCAIEGTFPIEKLDGLVALATDLTGLA
ncbi:TetR family transcriptional regulator [Vulcanimicrobium alpinum]|uniref:TetR family transcriptional regulator n=1 Tax=Vulcanimicrobium alpinum TaxID=3016050 RepID=A0AAN1XXR3_UNVUL|nr:TetR/AcrR family transcriptional regulator [Vulcanimicrobium alpinum]BDE06879.1 TetR family transcriptional regulator [Vulcanimicrobium alpinum]